MFCILRGRQVVYAAIFALLGGTPVSLPVLCHGPWHTFAVSEMNCFNKNKRKKTLRRFIGAEPDKGKEVSCKGYCLWILEREHPAPQR